MSRTTLYRVPPLGPFVVAEEFSNAWGSGMRIWNSMWQRHVDPTADVVPTWHGLEALDPLWRLADNPAVPLQARLVLVTTFDHALAEHAKLATLADYFRWFDSHYPTKPGSANSLQAQADCLDRLAALPSMECAGAAWQQTSVSENPWWVATNDDAGRSYDVSIDTSHFWLFERYW